VRDLKQKKYATAQININQSIRGRSPTWSRRCCRAGPATGAGDSQAAVANIDKLTGPEWYRSSRTACRHDPGLAGKEKDAGIRSSAPTSSTIPCCGWSDAYARWLSRSKDGCGRLRRSTRPFRARSCRGIRWWLERAAKKCRAGQEAAAAGRFGARPARPKALYGIGATLTRRGGEDLALVYLQLSLLSAARAHPLALLSLADPL
jgi:hypothetical protein